MELIDRINLYDVLKDAIINFFKRNEYDVESAILFKDIVKEIKDVPVIDAVEVVRCKECKHRDPEDKICDCGCWHMPFITNDDDFCSYGKRKDGLSLEKTSDKTSDNEVVNDGTD